MPTFVFAYRRTPGRTPAPTPESTAAWKTWFDAMGDDLVDLGKPAAGAAALGNCGPGTELGGYSVISARRTWTRRWPWPRAARSWAGTAAWRSPSS